MSDNRNLRPQAPASASQDAAARALTETLALSLDPSRGFG
jgi:hypothetical protein